MFHKKGRVSRLGDIPEGTSRSTPAEAISGGLILLKATCNFGAEVTFMGCWVLKSWAFVFWLKHKTPPGYRVKGMYSVCAF